MSNCGIAATDDVLQRVVDELIVLKDGRFVGDRRLFRLRKPRWDFLTTAEGNFYHIQHSSIRESQARARESPNSGADRNSNFIAEVPPNYLLQFTADPPENSVSVGIEFCGGENTGLLNSLQ